mgnify:CR=1 FL=1
MSTPTTPIRANSLTPFEPTHPGLVLSDELKFRGIGLAQLAETLSMPQAALAEMLQGKRELSVEQALLIEAALGITAEPLLNMQARYDINMAKRNPSFLQRLSSIRHIAAAF